MYGVEAMAQWTECLAFRKSWDQAPGLHKQYVIAYMQYIWRWRQENQKSRSSPYIANLRQVFLYMRLWKKKPAIKKPKRICTCIWMYIAILSSLKCLPVYIPNIAHEHAYAHSLTTRCILFLLVFVNSVAKVCLLL